MPIQSNNFVVNAADLEYILKQIKIAEATSLAYSPDVAPVSILQAIMNAYDVSAANAAQMPAGLRTVDGTFNNLFVAPTGTPGTPGYDPGSSEFGAADTLFPRLTDPVYVNDGDGDVMFLGPGAPLITNTNYGIAGRSVADADPRIISNLIVDMSVNNAAAIEVALGRVGIVGTAATTARNAIIAARNGHPAALAAAVAAQAAETAALALIATETGEQAAAVTAAAAAASVLATADAALAQDILDLADASAASDAADLEAAMAAAADEAAQIALSAAQSAYDTALAANGANAGALAAATTALAAANEASVTAANAVTAALAAATLTDAAEESAAKDLLAALEIQSAAQVTFTAAQGDLDAARSALAAAQDHLADATAASDAADAALASARSEELAAQDALDAARIAVDAAVIANQPSADALASATTDLAGATTAHEAALASITDAASIADEMQSAESAAASNLLTAQENRIAAQEALDAAAIANEPTAATLANAMGGLADATTAHEAAVAAVTDALSTANAMQAIEQEAANTLATAQEARTAAQADVDAALIANQPTAAALESATTNLADATIAHEAAVASVAGALSSANAMQALEDAAADDLLAAQDVRTAAQSASDAAVATLDAYDAALAQNVELSAADASLATGGLVAILGNVGDALDDADHQVVADAVTVATSASSAAAAAHAALQALDVDPAHLDAAAAAATHAALLVTQLTALQGALQVDGILDASELAAAETALATASESVDLANASTDGMVNLGRPAALDRAAAAQVALDAAAGTVTAAQGVLVTATANSDLADAALASAQLDQVAAQSALDAAEGAFDAATIANQPTAAALAAATSALAAAANAVTTAEGVLAAATVDSDEADAALDGAQGHQVATQAALDTAQDAVTDATLANQPTAAALAAATTGLAAASSAVTTAEGVLAMATAASDTADAALAAAHGDALAAQVVLDAARAAFDAATIANAPTAAALASANADFANAIIARDAAADAASSALSTAATLQALEEAAATDLTTKQGIESSAQSVADAAGTALASATDGVEAAQSALATASANSDAADATLTAAQRDATVAQAAVNDAQSDYDAAFAASGPAAATLTAATSNLAAATAAHDLTDAALTAANATAATKDGLETAAAADLSASQAAQAAADGSNNAARTALAAADAELAAARSAATAATEASDAADLATRELDNVLDSFGVDQDPSGSLLIRAQSPDIGLSPSFNSWMTYFGQFFDHGLDLVTKGGAGTVYIPLQADDPLIAGADGITGNADDLPTHLRFMALTRATQTRDANGVLQHENTTTSFVDQNQTYTSHASHQVFLREYVKDAAGHAVSTGKLLDGTVATGSVAGAIANWTDVKAQALTMLGIKLSDFDVHNVPLLVTDQYGKFIPGANGYAQLVMAATNPDGSHVVVEGTAAGISTAGALGTNHAFLNDIAHHAAPAVVDHDRNPATPVHVQTADVDTDRNGDGIIDAAELIADDGSNLTYDDELLNSHFITGDGRGNENIALTAVHSIFHSEHNRTVDANKATILATAASGDLAVLNEWLLVDVNEVPANPSSLVWDGERLFQAARFSTEMQYQHMVFEEFARRIQPMVDPFVFNNSPEIDASIVAEFAHTVYRFGHSMLTGTVDRLTNDLTTIDGADQATLLAVFLNPQAYVRSGATLEEINANLVRGLSRDVGSHIDEFIVDDVRSNLVGLPLDLGALNIARGRDTGMPSLNETRRQLYDDTALADLKPYDNWADFAAHIKNAASIVNFIAAYGTHTSIASATTLAGKRAAAELIVFGGTGAPADRLDFINATGAFAGGNLGGLNLVDLWIGGLAEANPEFGGMLGTTFNYVFEAQMEDLQNGDRMYYLTRTQGQNMLNQLEANTFADMVMRNTDLGDAHATHLNGQLFITPDLILELDRGIAQEDYNGALAGRDPTFADDEPHSPFDQKVTRSYDGVPGPDGHDVGGTLRFKGGEHVVLGGTEGNDRLYGDLGDDTLWGDAGDDYLNGGSAADEVFGGTGDDIIEDPFGDDFLRGQAGNDVITSARGFDLMFGNEGQDAIFVGQDAGEAFGGQGDDFILGGAGQDLLLGNEGNDWIEGGPGFDTLAADNSELFFNSAIQGHDVLFGQGDETDYDAESGDDIMGSGSSVYRYEGMHGFDWGIGKGDAGGVDFDLQIKIFTAAGDEVLRDRFDHVEALSGYHYHDVLDGDDRGTGAAGEAAGITADGLFVDDILTQAGIDRIAGFDAWFQGARTTLFGGATPLVSGTEVATSFRDGNILMGGDGNDVLRGRGGYDLLDGDAYLNVRIGINIDGTYYSAESLNTDISVAGPYAGRVYAMVGNDPAGEVNFAAGPAFGGRSLTALLLDRTINPGQMSIVREIKYDATDVTGAAMNIDTAVFAGVIADYTIEGRTVDAAGQQLSRARDVNGDGFIAVTDTVGSDDTDLVKNIEELRFADRTLVIAGPNLKQAPAVDLHAFDLVTTVTAQYLDTFNVQSATNSNGTTAWTTPWVEANDGTNVIGGGQIQLNVGGTEAMRFIAGDGASITRAVNLSPTQPTTLSYVYSYSGLDTGDTLTVQFAANGTDFVTVQTIAGAIANNAAQGPTPFSVAVTGSATSAVRFITSAMTDIEGIRIDDVSLVTGTSVVTPANDGTGFTTTFIEDNAPVAIAFNTSILDSDSPSMVSAQIRLTNAQALDALSVAGALPAGITSSLGAPVAGQITLNLNGVASIAAYRTAIEAVRFANTSLNPSVTPRIIEVTVNDGEAPSAPAIATVNVVSVNDAPVTVADTIVTNISSGDIVVPEWVLLANDSDPEGAVLDITSVQAAVSVTGLSLATNPGSVTFADDGAAAGSFTYTASDGVVGGTTNGAVTVTNTGYTTLADNFQGPNNATPSAANNSSGTTSWAAASWTETDDDANIRTGQIRIDAGAAPGTNDLRFGVGDGASITRVVNLAGVSAATLSLAFDKNGIDTGESVLVQFAADGINFTTLSTITNTNGTAANGNANGTLNGLVLPGTLGAASAIRFVGSAINTAGEDIRIDNVSVAYGTANANVTAAAGNQVLIGNDAGSSFTAGAGNDTVLANGGDDTINWSVGHGRDFVDGGANAALGDRFIVNGDATVENYLVYARANAVSAGVVVQNAATEIVITRNGVVVAELDNIEEITINTAAGADTVVAVGDFNPTSLNFNTITVNGGAGRDTIDASQLTSAHRLVLNPGSGEGAPMPFFDPQGGSRVSMGLMDIKDLAMAVDVTGSAWSERPYSGLHNPIYDRSPAIDEFSAVHVASADYLIG